ncbi:hypothetical protein EO93_13280 [Methanosarcina sp. 1.H.A.2.2]|nr:hypothetical protein EO93_13280 [Methanosarcina sp. 1.H.A.2.2]
MSKNVTLKVRLTTQKKVPETDKMIKKLQEFEDSVIIEYEVFALVKCEVSILAHISKNLYIIE